MSGSPQLQMNGTSASAIHALPTSLPGQATTSALTQKLAGVEDRDQRRTMLGKHHTVICSLCRDLMAPQMCFSGWLVLRTMTKCAVRSVRVTGAFVSVLHIVVYSTC